MVVFLQKRIKNAINVNGPKCFWQTIKGEARNQENIIITSRVDKEKKILVSGCPTFLLRSWCAAQDSFRFEDTDFSFFTKAIIYCRYFTIFL